MLSQNGYLKNTSFTEFTMLLKGQNQSYITQAHMKTLGLVLTELTIIYNLGSYSTLGSFELKENSVASMTLIS
jgi:hypothetical protein